MIVAPVGMCGTAARHSQNIAYRLVFMTGGVLGVVLLLGQVRDEHVGALPGVRDRHRPADAGVPARDDRLAAGEFFGAPVALLAVIGPVRHGRGRAGWLLVAPV
jgi:hypothetical protein